jgi:hypothetical protein
MTDGFQWSVHLQPRPVTPISLFSSWTSVLSCWFVSVNPTTFWYTSINFSARSVFFAARASTLASFTSSVAVVARPRVVKGSVHHADSFPLHFPLHNRGTPHRNAT